MKGNLQKALDNTEMMYSQLVTIANDIVDEHIAEASSLIDGIVKNVENLTNDAIRTSMLKLSLMAFSFGDIKEKSSLKAECAEALRKEAYAMEFNSTDGSVATKENTAIINTSDEILTETIYNLVASLFKNKLDEMHRVVDTLKTVLMSRVSEAKLVQGGMTE